MDNEPVKEESWWKRHWKWSLPLGLLCIFLILTFFSSDIDKAVTNMAQAYSDTELYENALAKVKSDPRATELLGNIEPIDKLAIFEGAVGYSDDNKTVNSSIRVKGEKLIARMEIAATRINGSWKYTKINIRVKNPPEKRQLIEIVSED